ncbi:MAG: thioredoxin domain-containing protein [Acidimicrobiales bacterium]|nr:thioredoxin domain-containing protein [Acidimicrobiales bacterium]
MNRLAHETSPYLRQHRDNPVDWYPWGQEAFDRARTDDRPILLSVGYSACHWCHVMAHESFEDPDTAAVMNELFVNVKVDREERPDVDAIYMEAVQAMAGRGGWPMTVFLAPDGRPFFGGTYFPRVRRGSMPSFVELLRAVAEAWRERRSELLEQADRLTEAIGRVAGLAAGDELPGVDTLDTALSHLADQFDPEWGGFGRAPKFPQAMALELALRSPGHRSDDRTRTVVTTSLDAMASGGIYDHLGGGFARYSTDAFWMVPHFEKMLYDQALLARVYLHAWQVTGEERYRQVATETIEYVLRDLRHPAGGFFSAEDADSEGEEGRFYVWRQEEMEDVLGPDAPGAIEWYGVTRSGNFEGANILHRPLRGDLVRPPAIEAARQQLLEARGRRVRPGLDDKVLTEWNGLMLATLAEAAAALGRADWLEAAVANAEFLLAHLRRPTDGRWLRSWQGDDGGRARHLAFAADHAALVDAFTRVAEATGEARWIEAARDAADRLLALFLDDAEGGVFTTGSDAEALVTRPKDVLDNATPSANSLAALALLRLAALTGEPAYRERAEAILRLLGPLAAEHPTAFAHLLAAVHLHVSGATEIAIVGDRPDLVRAVAARYVPNAVVAWGEPYRSPLWEGRRAGLAYVCRDFACRAPVDAVDDLLAQLDA